MKQSITHYALVFSLLTAGLSFTAIPEAEAKLSRAKVKRCLSGRFPVKLTETQFGFFNAAPYVNPLQGGGGLRVGGGQSTVSQRTFIFRSTSVRGQNKIIVRGGCRIAGTVVNAVGSVKLTIVKRGRRAQITSGRYTYAGTDFLGNTFNTTTGRIRGSKRLPRSCQH